MRNGLVYLPKTCTEFKTLFSSVFAKMRAAKTYLFKRQMNAARRR